MLRLWTEGSVWNPHFQFSLAHGYPHYTLYISNFIGEKLIARKQKFWVDALADTRNPLYDVYFWDLYSKNLAKK